MIKHFNFRLGKKNLIFLLLLFFLSTLFYLSITLDQPVIFEDPNFELAVRELLGHSGKPVYRSQLLSIIELDIAGRGISNLSGIENFRNLRDLNLSNNKISDVGLLHTLNNLRRLDLGYNEIIDLETANFNSILHLDLKYLNLDHNFVLDSYDRPIKLSDIELLHHFDNLEILSLEGNWIKEFNPVTDFENIQLLNMRDNQIKDINFLEKMPNLEHLNMRGNRLAEISVIGELTELEYLNLHSNKFIKSIQPLGNLTRLEKLILRNVPVDDVSIFLNFPELRYLNVRNSSISDFEVLAKLMTSGALQDDIENKDYAFLNIRENVIHNNHIDPLASIRPYWNNIKHRNPYELPPLGQPLIDPPMFSQKGGFFTDSFELVLSSNDPHHEIYFTLDGSDPDINYVGESKSLFQQTELYVEPIYVSSRVGEENLFSMIVTSGATRGWLPRWAPPKGEVFKATVVRAIVYDPVKDIKSDIYTQTYFVDEEMNQRYSTIPVISLVADYDVLFNKDTGIYITGFGDTPYRYRFYRVPANIEYFEPSGNLGFQGRFEISLQGATSPASPQKGLHVFTDIWSSGEEYLEYPLFKDSESKANQLTEFKRFMIRSWGSARNWPVFFADAYNQTLMARSDLDIQDYRPVIVFINGEYWGIHELREANKNSWYYRVHYYDGEEMDFDLLDWGGTEVDEGDSEHWDNLIDFVIDHDLSIDENYQYIHTQIDIDNFITYMVHCLYTGKLDWPGQNEYMWRPKTDDGIWRWTQQDMDQGMSPWAGPGHNMFPQVLTGGDREHLLFNALLENQEFQNLFLNYYADLMNTYFLTSVERNHFTIMVEELEPYMDEYQDRWQLNYDWEEDKQFAYDLINRRWETRRQQVINTFNLRGSSFINLFSDPGKGSVKINSIEINNNTPGVNNPSTWQGMYFHDVPITLIATPLPGHRFKAWKSQDGIFSFQRELNIILDGDIQLEAVFEPIP